MMPARVFHSEQALEVSQFVMSKLRGKIRLQGDEAGRASSSFLIDSLIYRRSVRAGYPRR